MTVARVNAPAAVSAPASPPPAPEPGRLVYVRNRPWVVAEVSSGGVPAQHLDQAPSHLVTLTSVEDDHFDESLQVIWELEPGTATPERATLPTPQADHLDDPDRLAAFLDAVRWGAVTSADAATLQAPWRSGIAIEDYQLDPVVRALRMPRVNLLVADDVGLGKTIEAGLVVQELLLRHRARSVLVVCPASLCIKWRDEMAEKFGLEFRIVDTEALRHLRRTRGLRANPFTHFPRLIVSMDWLKRDRPMRLLADVLPAAPSYPRTFDLLIVDEVHNVAPSGRGRYATDSQRTKAIRRIAPHFEHRLFLSATPHNGYPESWTALLELLDPQRFMRNVPPEAAQLARIMVRRLKSELPPRPDGTPRFPTRDVQAIEVAYPPDERAAHRLLADYGAARRRSLTGAGDHEHPEHHEHPEVPASRRLALEFTLILLKKRLFSSPPALAHTLEVHRETLRGRPEASLPPSPAVLRAVVERTEEDAEDGDQADEAVREALAATARASGVPGEEELALLDRLCSWASAAAGGPDAKAHALLGFLDDVVRPPGPDGQRRWGDERVIVFTEYRDTQRYLVDVLEAHGLGGDRLALLYGGMDEQAREATKATFQADPSLDPVRILVATDAASEGIDLQRHCHRLVHYEIPWNPARLEQRNGRIDRHGQHAPAVLVHHFVGAGYRDTDGYRHTGEESASHGASASTSLGGDLQFLHQVALKVNTIRQDLGSAGPVIADQVEQRMLGRRRHLDQAEIDRAAPRGRLVGIERDLRTRIERLRERLEESVTQLHLAPANVERVVRTALALAHQPDLVATTLDRPAHPGSAPAFHVPRLTHSWARATEGLAHPVTGQVRPITFDHAVAADHDDVVLAHLGHRLVAQAVWLLRAEVWAGGAGAGLARVTARVVPDSVAEELAVVAHGRLVITGGGGQRLHEEVITAAGWVRGERFARLPGVAQVEAIVDAPTLGLPDPGVCRRLVAAWPRIAEGLMTALTRRQQERSEALAAILARRAEEDARAIEAVLAELEHSIRRSLAGAGADLQLALPGFAPDERSQAEADLSALRCRLEEIPAEAAREAGNLRRRYADPSPRLFPAAVELCVPERLAGRP